MESSILKKPVDRMCGSFKKNKAYQILSSLYFKIPCIYFSGIGLTILLVVGDNINNRINNNATDSQISSAVPCKICESVAKKILNTDPFEYSPYDNTCCW